MATLPAGWPERVDSRGERTRVATRSAEYPRGAAATRLRVHGLSTWRLELGRNPTSATSAKISTSWPRRRRELHQRETSTDPPPRKTSAGRTRNPRRYICFGILNWAAYGKDTQTVLTVDLPRGPWKASVQVAYTLAVIFTFPLQLYPAIQILKSVGRKLKRLTVGRSLADVRGSAGYAAVAGTGGSASTANPLAPADSAPTASTTATQTTQGPYLMTDD